jgi:hypothetical protein
MRVCRVDVVLFAAYKPSGTRGKKMRTVGRAIADNPKIKPDNRNNDHRSRRNAMDSARRNNTFRKTIIVTMSRSPSK